MNDVEWIDISPFTTPTANCSEADRITVAQDVARALSTKGFVHLTGHGIPQTLIESAFAITGSFFSGTDETKKQACSKDRARRGYSPCHAENFASLLGTMNAPNDSVEKFRCGPMVDEVTKAEDSSYYGRYRSGLHPSPPSQILTLPFLQIASRHTSISLPAHSHPFHYLLVFSLFHLHNMTRQQRRSIAFL